MRGGRSLSSVESNGEDDARRPVSRAAQLRSVLRDAMGARAVSPPPAARRTTVDSGVELSEAKAKRRRRQTTAVSSDSEASDSSETIQSSEGDARPTPTADAPFYVARDDIDDDDGFLIDDQRRPAADDAPRARHEVVVVADVESSSSPERARDVMKVAVIALRRADDGQLAEVGRFQMVVRGREGQSVRWLTLQAEQRLRELADRGVFALGPSPEIGAILDPDTGLILDPDDDVWTALHDGQTVRALVSSSLRALGLVDTFDRLCGGSEGRPEARAVLASVLQTLAGGDLESGSATSVAVRNVSLRGAPMCALTATLAVPSHAASTQQVTSLVLEQCDLGEPRSASWRACSSSGRRPRRGAHLPPCGTCRWQTARLSLPALLAWPGRCTRALASVDLSSVLCGRRGAANAARPRACCR